MGIRDVMERVRGFAEGAVSGWKSGRKTAVPAAGEVFFDRKRAANPVTWWGLLPDPDLVLTKLGQDLTVYRELLTDAHVSSCVQSRSAGVICGEWRVEPGGPGRASKKAAEGAEAALQGLDMDRVLREVLDAVYFGMSPLEALWEREGGSWRPVDLVGRPPEWFKFDTENQLRFLSRENAWLGEEVPPYAILLARHKASYRNPYGERVLASCFWPAAFKKGGMKYWAEFTEKYGMPWAVGKLPSMATDLERQNLRDVLSLMVRSAVAVIADNQSVELMTDTSRAASADVYSRMVETCNAEISKAVLSQTLTTEMGPTGGSYAASQTHQEVRADVVDSDKRLVKATFRELFTWLRDLNHPGAEVPEFVFFEEADPRKDIAERNEVLKRTEPKLSFTLDYYYKTFNFEEGDIELVEPEPPPFIPPPDGAAEDEETDGEEDQAKAADAEHGGAGEGEPEDGPPEGDEGKKEKKKEGEEEFTEAVRGPRALPSVDELAEDGATRAAAAMAGVRDAVALILENASSFEDFVRELYAAWPTLDLDGLADALAETGFKAGVLGRLSVPAPKGAAFAEDFPAEGTSLDPEEAIRFFRVKGYRITWNWREMWKEEHSRAFTVAHCNRADILVDIRRAVDDALKNGRTFAEFQKGLMPTLETKGWWGKTSGVNPLTGEEEDYVAGTPARLRTIFDTNLATAHAAGRYKQMAENKASAPLWQYVTVKDDRVREEHAVLDGKVFPADDPFWETMYPPNGWGCRCSVIPLTGAQAKDMGLEIESGSQPGPDGQPELLPEYQGLAKPEWSYNPGRSAWRGVTPEYEDDPGRWVPAGPDNLLSPSMMREIPPERVTDVPAADLVDPKGKTDEELVNLFLGEFGGAIGKPATWTDPVGNRLAITEDLFIDRKRTAKAGETVYKVDKRDRGRYLKLLAETVKDPLEIKVMDGTKRQGAREFAAPFLKYVKAFRIVGADGEVRTGFVSFYWDGRRWYGETVFQPDFAQYWDEEKGVLIFRKA